MPITGLSFLLFALAAVVLYYLFPKRLRQYGVALSKEGKRMGCF